MNGKLVQSLHVVSARNSQKRIFNSFEDRALKFLASSLAEFELVSVPFQEDCPGHYQ
jgi:hypothetical protein